MGLSPVPAVNNLLKNTDIGMEDFELIEVNEAFAAQYIRMRMPLWFQQDRGIPISGWKLNRE